MDGNPDSMILEVWLSQEGIRSINIIPVTIGLGGQPAIANPGDAQRIREHVNWLSNELNVP
jgi:hypothetical protein